MIKFDKDKSIDYFKTLFNDNRNGICIVNNEGKVIELNKYYADLFGFNKKDLIGKHYTDFVADEHIPTAKKNHRKIFNGTDILKAEEKVKHKNGTYFYLQTTNIKVNDSNGNKLRITTAVDVSKRLKNELVQSVLLEIANLTNYSMPNQKFYSSIHSAICKLVPIKNMTVSVNNYISEYVDYPYNANEYNMTCESELEKEYEIFSEYKKPILISEQKINELIEENKLCDYLIKPKSILVIPLIISNNLLGTITIKDYVPREYSKNELELLEIVASQIANVVDRKNYEEKLIFAKNTAEEALKLKSEFLAQISHEIRTPLNSIVSFASLIKAELEEHLSEDLTEAFQHIERGGSRLTRTIDLILNASKSQKNDYQIFPEELLLCDDILNPLVKELQTKAKQKNLNLNFINPENKIRLVCDQYSTTQLFSNLIENAIKYTKEGSIDISLFYNKMGQIQVDVKDTGIGISEDYFPKLFEPFSQEEQGYTRTYEGIGLGLSLVKNYAELNNANISVQSKKNEGSLFSVIFN
ncbi:MAG: hypothetical protein CR986_09765 [Ignavibacteriae bacterium]|nr:MAG: hypothetical protein CR986_09765 [Ignavibacteriota bacterium]